MALTFPSVAALVCYLGATLSSERQASLLRTALLLGWIAHGLALAIDIAGIGKIFSIAGALPNAGGPDTPFSLRAELGINLAAALPICTGNTQITSPNVTLEIFGNGWFRGRVGNILPNCPQSAGPFQITFTSPLKYTITLSGRSERRDPISGTWLTRSLQTTATRRNS